MPKSLEEMKAAMIAGLKENTGKSLDEWLEILRASGLAKHKEMVTLLKTKHGLTHGFANMIAMQAIHSDSHTANDTDALVAAQFSGKKTGRQPLFDALLVAVKMFGKDIEVSPKKGLRQPSSHQTIRDRLTVVQHATGCRFGAQSNQTNQTPGSRRQFQRDDDPPNSHRKRQRHRQRVHRLPSPSVRTGVDRSRPCQISTCRESVRWNWRVY